MVVVARKDLWKKSTANVVFLKRQYGEKFSRLFKREKFASIIIKNCSCFILILWNFGCVKVSRFQTIGIFKPI
jgi:hypothetical protein